MCQVDETYSAFVMNSDSSDTVKSNVGSYIKVGFNDVFGEPPGLDSVRMIWNFSVSIYKVIQTTLFIILCVIIGPFLAILWGINFAVFSFLMVWCANPLLRCNQILCAPLKAYNHMLYQCLCEPCWYSAGSCFSRIKIQNQTLPQGTDKPYNVFEV